LTGIYWFHYEKIKGILSPGVPSFSASFFAGAAAGSVSFHKVYQCNVWSALALKEKFRHLYYCQVSLSFIIPSDKLITLMKFGMNAMLSEATPKILHANEIGLLTLQ
jgi:hypothetical protein